MTGQQMADKPKKNSALEDLWNAIRGWAISDESARTKINVIPIPDDVLNTSAAELLINPPKFPDLKR